MAVEPPAGGPPAPGKGKGKGKGLFGRLSKDQKVFAGVAGGGGLLALLVLARRGKSGAGAGDTSGDLSTTGQPYVQPGMYSDGGMAAYQNLQDEIESLQGRIEGLPGVGQVTPTPVTPTPSTPAGTRAPLSGPWKAFAIGKGQSIADLVRKSHPGWSAAQQSDAARQIAIYNKRPGQADTKFTAARTVYLR